MNDFFVEAELLQETQITGKNFPFGGISRENYYKPYFSSRL
jgi:hypothetical protein